MARLTWLLCLVLAAVGRGSGIGAKITPGRLSVESDDVQKRVADSKIAAKSADNHSDVLKLADEVFPAPRAVGSLTCMRWTGGTCAILACKEERGATCEDGFCVCKQAGTCANAEGKCVANSEGEWIGEYSIRFGKPFLPERPFLGIGKEGGSAMMSGMPKWYSARMNNGGIAWLATVSSSEKQWKIAQTPNGRVRLTNTRHPGSVLTIYNNRRRDGFMQRQARREQKNATRKMSDDDDLWPVLMKLEAATPLAATFQVRPTMRNGGGYELWDPENKVALASADPESWGDTAVGEGVTECDVEDTSWSEDPCEGGKQLVAFDPALPGKALVEVHRSHIVAIANLSWVETCFLYLSIICCCACFLPREGEAPLVYHTYKYVEAGFESRAQAARQTEAEEERVCNALAQKIKGLWILESNIGNFEYELQEDPEGTRVRGMSVRGRLQGASEWDSWIVGHFNGAGSLCWDDDGGTKFTLAFEDDTCSGIAMAGGGQEVSFTGKRT